ncbi:MAG TPA: hypothetical protein VIM81_15100 [Gammaproteobacteria bacterium]
MSHPARRLATSHAAALSMALGAMLVSSDLAANERPDFTGVWGVYREPGQAGGGFGFGAPETLPLRPEAQAKIDEYNALVAPAQDTPGGFCLGTGMPGSMLGSGGYPMEIVQHEDIIVVIYEAHGEIRHIHIGNRAPEEDLFPDRNGYSVGRWEGDKLIVETTHLKEAVDQRRYPHSDQARIVEEYELITNDDASKVLVANMTMTDPVFYTEPITAEKKWSFLPGVRLLPYECNEPTWEEYLDSLREQAAE